MLSTSFTFIFILYARRKHVKNPITKYINNQFPNCIDLIRINNLFVCHLRNGLSLFPGACQSIFFANVKSLKLLPLTPSALIWFRVGAPLTYMPSVVVMQQEPFTAASSETFVIKILHPDNNTWRCGKCHKLKTATDPLRISVTLRL